ncbi:MAG: tetratricopeptide repeat protein, partial [Holophagales bacterium]|nr:tetratricopeptide repeat protein [Holophagales bacterium]
HIIARANRIADLASRSGDPHPWEELQAELAKAGFTVSGNQVAQSVVGKPAEDDRIAQLLEDLSLESFEGAQVSQPIETLLSTEEPTSGVEVPAVPPPPAEADAEAQVQTQVEDGAFSLANVLADEGLEDSSKPAAEAAPPASTLETAPESGLASMDETGMSWLDEPTPAPESSEKVSLETIFDEEDDFFDLAAELEAELGEGATAQIDEEMLTSVESQEQSLEEIIEGFKQGVAENLSPEDYDTHFNLGIAYREMGLMDEAIGEFQLASKDPRYLVECASMLGICFQEKGHLDLSLRWYQKGLAAPDISEEATLGLLYDMGETYISMGDPSSAYKTFVEIYGMNSNFRDVSVRVRELAPQEQA